MTPQDAAEGVTSSKTKIHPEGGVAIAAKNQLPAILPQSHLVHGGDTDE